MESDTKRIRYVAEPTLRRFHGSDAFVRGIMGPFGSGKSVGCVMEGVIRGQEQEAFEGVRRTRGAIVRSTYPELISTSMQTWREWVPEELCPIVREKNGPLKGTFRNEMPDGTTMEMEVYFIALDRAEDVGKLKSLELTWAWINEASEVPKAGLDMLTGRVGRYPSMRQGGPTWRGIWMDTNAPEEDHWYYKLAEIDRPEGYEFFRQPPAVLRVPGKAHSDPGAYAPNMGQAGFPPAENIKNLKGGFDYYMKQQVPGKDETWIRVFLMVEYGTVMAGKPIYPEYHDAMHCSKEILQPARGLPLIVAFDFGLTPVATFHQFSPRGQLRTIDELIAEDMGIRNFAASIVRPHIQANYSGMMLHVVGDPAGNSRSQTDEQTCFEILAEEGFRCEPAKTNNFMARREAVVRFLTRMSDGLPAYQISPKCVHGRRGFISKYAYKKLRTQVGDRYADEPDKNHPFSDLHDSIQYAAMYAEQSPAVTGEHAAGPGKARRIVTNRARARANN